MKASSILLGMCLAIAASLAFTASAQECDTQSDNWWTAFNDPTLDRLIAAGIDNNYNLAMAARRIEIARYAMRSARAAWSPQLGVSAGWTKERSSGRLGKVAADATTADFFDLGLNVSWEIDLFGKIASAVKGKDALYKATRAENEAAMLSLAGQIATTYFSYCSYTQQLALAENHAVNQQHVVEITEARHEAGIGNALEVAQAKIVLNSTRASIPDIESAIEQSRNALAVLLGVYPDEITSLLSQGNLPEYHGLVGSEVPMELLRRRPDVVEAERQLEAYAAEVGVAKKDFLPTLTLNGSIGTQAHRLDNLFTSQSYTYSIAPALSWTLFDGLARKNALASARRQMEIGMDNYNQTLLTAVQEARNAMTAYSADLSKIDLLGNVIDESRKACTLSIDLYKHGLAAFTNVYNAQIDVLQYETSLIQARAQALTDLVTLYVALGGAIN